MAMCVYDGVEKDMPWQSPRWANFARGPRSAFWSARPQAAQAWCDAEPGRGRTAVRCHCYAGERSSRLCEPVSPNTLSATFCLNQCSHRGDCLGGHCRCARGFHGADCSVANSGGLKPAASIPAASAPESAPRPRIYVYELPGEFNSFLLSRRQNGDSCALRE